MLAGRALARALERARLMRYEGVLCRAVHAATLYGFKKEAACIPRPLYDLGPPAGGARFTPRGGAPALYLADDYETSLHEYLQVGSHVRLRARVDTGAIVLFVAEVRLERVLDLTDRRVLSILGATPAELRQPWRFPRCREAAAREETPADGPEHLPIRVCRDTPRVLLRARGSRSKPGCARAASQRRPCTRSRC
jgi:RES domain-containing protein